MNNVINIEEWKQKKEDVLSHTLDTRLFLLHRPHLSYFALCNIWDENNDVKQLTSQQQKNMVPKPMVYRTE